MLVFFSGRHLKGVSGTVPRGVGASDEDTPIP